MSRYDEIRERVAAATPGPWRSTTEGSYTDMSWVRTEGDDWLNVALTDAPENAAFIAAARDDVPFLLAEVERLRAAVDEYLLAIERGFAHWEADHPVTGEHLSGDPTVVFLGREQWYEPTRRLRALLAAPPEASRE